MTTQAEKVAQEVTPIKVCFNCIHSHPGFKRKQPVLKCSHTGKIIPPNMHECWLWKRSYE